MVSPLSEGGSRARGRIDATLIEKPRRMPEYLRSRIRGQDHVIDRVCSVLKRGELGLRFARKKKRDNLRLFLYDTGDEPSAPH